MQNPYIPLHCVRNLNIPLHAGLGTAFFCVQHATFFCVLLKNATFFFAFFSNFWRLMKPKRMLRSFAFFLKERSFFQKNARSFEKNALSFKRTCVLSKEHPFFSKECAFFFNPKKECNVLFFHSFLGLKKN